MRCFVCSLLLFIILHWCASGVLIYLQLESRCEAVRVPLQIHVVGQQGTVSCSAQAGQTLVKPSQILVQLYMCSASTAIVLHCMNCMRHSPALQTACLSGVPGKAAFRLVSLCSNMVAAAAGWRVCVCMGVWPPAV